MWRRTLVQVNREVLALTLSLCAPNGLLFAQSESTPFTARLRHIQPRYELAVPSGNWMRDRGEALTREMMAISVNAADVLLQEALPPSVRVTVVTEHCATPNADYSPRQQSIRVCYELLSHAITVARAAEVLLAEDSVTAEGGDFVVFAVLHEVGHALIHQRHLPVLGSAEDAADGFAVWASLRPKNRMAGGELVVLTGELLLATMQYQESEANDYVTGFDDYVREHPFPGQRSARIRCFREGARSSKAAGEDKNTARCLEEWQRLNESWNALLPTARGRAPGRRPS